VDDGFDEEEDGDGETLANGKENKNRKRWEWDVDVPLGSSVSVISDQEGREERCGRFMLDGTWAFP